MHKIAPWPKITKATHSLPSFFNSRTAVKNACVQRFFYVSMKVEQNIASDLLICVMLSANETLTTGFNTYLAYHYNKKTECWKSHAYKSFSGG
jgi:hypothetical protein